MNGSAYSTYLYTTEVEQLIHDHDTMNPMFLCTFINLTSFHNATYSCGAFRYGVPEYTRTAASARELHRHLRSKESELQPPPHVLGYDRGSVGVHRKNG